MSKSACSAFGFVKFLHLNPFSLFVAGNDHLANAFAVLNLEIFGRKIDEYYAYFATIVGIDGAGSVEYGNPVLQSKTAARTNLRLVAFGKFNEKSRRDKFALHWLQDYWFCKVCTKVDACRLRGCILRQSIGRFVYYSDFHGIIFLIISVLLQRRLVLQVHARYTLQPQDIPA